MRCSAAVLSTAKSRNCSSADTPVRTTENSGAAAGTRSGSGLGSACQDTSTAVPAGGPIAWLIAFMPLGRRRGAARLHAEECELHMECVLRFSGCRSPVRLPHRHRPGYHR
jgi:hypothetical protein